MNLLELTSNQLKNLPNLLFSPCSNSAQHLLLFKKINPIIHNRKALKPYRKRLRNGSTHAECRLWLKIKNKQLGGRKFRRQHSVENFILDFYCPEEKLGIELDGRHHYTPEGMRKDKWRENIISSHGIKIIRFENRLVFEEIEYVLREIKKCFRN